MTNITPESCNALLFLFTARQSVVHDSRFFRSLSHREVTTTMMMKNVESLKNFPPPQHSTIKIYCLTFENINESQFILFFLDAR
jgi:hypothetical protein